MQRTCQWCGGTFDAPTVRARYCSGAHRAKAHKARAAGVTELYRRPPRPTTGPCRTAAVAYLESCGIDQSTDVYRVAVAVAAALDDPETTSSALPRVVDAMRTALDLIRSEVERKEADIYPVPKGHPR